MSKNRGIIALMGSGELTTTMVEVHKSLLRRYEGSARAVFVDTPAGFQLNVDQISHKAIEYFNLRIQQMLQIAAFQSASGSAASAEAAFDRIRTADYILVGPGSPTYALDQWQQSPVPDIFLQRVIAGGCFVAASAAALTVGRLTLPVYEIYKVGQPVHWVEGLNLLGQLGMDLAVIPHWNNAEGGNHDTRFCFMGQARLEKLVDALPQTTRILGLDEHTALVIDFEKRYATIQGIGSVTLKDRRREIVFTKNDRIPLAMLMDPAEEGEAPLSGRLQHTEDTSVSTPALPDQASDDDPWTAIHACADHVRQALDDGQDEQIATQLLELERLIWASRGLLEEQNAMGAAREVLREALATLTAALALRPKNRHACLSELVDAVLRLRHQFRDQKKYEEADALRNSLERVGIQIMDSPDGSTWTTEL